MATSLFELEPPLQPLAMKINRILQLAIGLLLVTIFSFLPISPLRSQQNRPNILLVVSDDLGFSDLGLFGSEIDTPITDQVAQQGVTFTNFHASPVCSITRGQLLTGNNSIEVGLGAFDYTVYPPTQGKPGYEAYLTRNTVTIAELLQDAGYNTYTTGKWHLGGTAKGGEGPSKWGFTRSYGIYTGGSNHWNQQVMIRPVALKQGQIPEVEQEPFYLDGKPVQRPLGVYSADLYTSKMIEFMEEGRQTGKPFFAYLALTTPHFPLQAPSFLINKYYDYYLEKGYQGLKQERFQALQSKGIIPVSATFPTAENPLVSDWNQLSSEEKQFQARIMATYAAMIEAQDFYLGAMMDYLRESGQLDNTLVIFLSDNGPEGTDFTNEEVPEAVKQWFFTRFDQSIEAIGQGNSNQVTNASWADAATGALQWWKWFIAEGGIRTPMVIVPPKTMTVAKTGEQTNAIVSVKDLPMTILDYAGVKHPQGKYKGRKLVAPSGISIRPYLEGETPEVRGEDDWFALELFGNAMIIAGDYKAMRVRPGMYGDGQWHLYNIKKDPGETQSLNQQEPELLQKLIAIYDQYAKEKGIIPVTDDWSPFAPGS